MSTFDAGIGQIRGELNSYTIFRLVSNNGWEIAPYLQLCVILLRLGDDLASTWVAKPEVHAENVE